MPYDSQTSNTAGNSLLAGAGSGSMKWLNLAMALMGGDKGMGAVGPSDPAAANTMDPLTGYPFGNTSANANAPKVGSRLSY